MCLLRIGKISPKYKFSSILKEKKLAQKLKMSMNETGNREIFEIHCKAVGAQVNMEASPSDKKVWLAHFGMKTVFDDSIIISEPYFLGER